MTNFKKLPKTQLRKMAQAGNRILECYRLLGKNDANVVGEVLKGHGDFFEWDHYPPGDVYDHETHAQYYYHTHPPEDDNDELTHFVGISMDRAGFPIRLFTTNRWVTGETWYKAPSVNSMLDRFDMDLAYQSLPVNIWITAMLQLFRPDIEMLLKARDQAVRDWETEHPEENVYEDRGLEITSIQDISVEKQIKGVQRALKAA